jgi:predicted DNA binding CopG/RHH family protein
MRPVQYFSKEYLEQCRSMTPEQIVRFLDDFRQLQSKVVPAKSRLISMKVPEPLLDAFKMKARLSGVPYQTQIKRLMSAWLVSSGP